MLFTGITYSCDEDCLKSNEAERQIQEDLMKVEEIKKMTLEVIEYINLEISSNERYYNLERANEMLKHIAKYAQKLKVEFEEKGYILETDSNEFFFKVVLPGGNSSYGLYGGGIGGAE